MSQSRCNSPSADARHLLGQCRGLWIGASMHRWMGPYRPHTAGCSTDPQYWGRVASARHLDLLTGHAEASPSFLPALLLAAGRSFQSAAYTQRYSHTPFRSLVFTLGRHVAPPRWRRTRARRESTRPGGRKVGKCEVSHVRHASVDGFPGLGARAPGVDRDG